MLRRLSWETGRRIMAFTWLGFAVLQLAMVLYLYLRDWIGEENFRSALAQINASYVPYVGAILTFYLAERRRAVPAEERAGLPFGIAWGTSLVWNLVLAVFMFRVVMLNAAIEQTLKLTHDVGSMLSWLVAPAVGYYFSSSPPAEKQRGKV
jgi:hypothetical protein